MLRIGQIIGIIIILFVGFFGLQKYQDSKNSSTPQTTTKKEAESAVTTLVATGLEVPWALAFLPNGNILVTERAGRVRLIKDGSLQKEPIANISVKQIGESGLHGIAIDPNFSENNFVYLYYTYSDSGDKTLNRVSRFIYSNQSFTNEKILIDQIPGAIFHDGGRIKFGPDEYLYITTGDALNPSLAQDKNALAGKILRVVDGNVEVFSYGHRNPQGIAWASDGRLFETEHGNSATDEVNIIWQGKNYGWPTITGSQTVPGMETPFINSGSITWAPAGAAIYNNTLYFGGLRGNTLYSLDIKADYTLSVKEEKKVQEHFKSEFGRIRDVVLGPDNMLYITTSNRDRRGNPTSGDDRIIRIDPSKI